MTETFAMGRYRLTERLGTGAFATVWLGHDDELDAPVAIKVLAENWAHDADVHARFIAEARLLRRVRDQRVIRVHDIGTLPDGRPYFVMDYADGGTVAELIKAPERLDPAMALRLAADIGRAVQVLHDHGVAHRDIKPGNLLLTEELDRTATEPGFQRLNVVIADLGMAKTLAEASGYTVTAGTPAYMAPEQALGLGFDQRADVYSVAAVAYTLLAGRPPFAGAGVVEIAERSRASDPEPLGLDHTGTIDRELAAALAFDPDRRPATARDLARRFDRLADGLTHPTRPVSPVSPVSAISPVDPADAVTELQSAPRPTVLRTPARSTPAEPPTAVWAPAPEPAHLTVPLRPSAPTPSAPSSRRRTVATGTVALCALLLAVVAGAITWLLLTLLVVPPG